MHLVLNKLFQWGSVGGGRENFSPKQSKNVGKLKNHFFFIQNGGGQGEALGGKPNFHVVGGVIE